MQVITRPIPLTKLKSIAKKRFGNLVKAVVDVKRGVAAIDADLHADEEAALLAQGSKQEDLWGINIYPELTGNDFIDFDSMINLRPSAGNLTRGIDNPRLRAQIIKVVNALISS